MIRDQILFLSGKLNRKMYGESVKPPQPPGLWEAVSMAAPFTYVADKGDAIYRRSFTPFGDGHAAATDDDLECAVTENSARHVASAPNTPLQALLLMNEQEFFEAAKTCAELTLRSIEQRCRRGWPCSTRK